MSVYETAFMIFNLGHIVKKFEKECFLHHQPLNKLEDQTLRFFVIFCLLIIMIEIRSFVHLTTLWVFGR